MIGGHIVAVADMQRAVHDLRVTVEGLPESKIRFQMEARLDLLERDCERYANQSLQLYDQIFKFAASAMDP